MTELTLKKLTQSLITGVGLLALFGCAPSGQQNAEPAPTLSLERIYTDKEFNSERAPYFRWLDDGSGYTVLEARSKNTQQTDDDSHGVTGNDIVFYQPDGSGRKVLVTVEQLTPEGADDALSIENYQWSEDGKWALIFTNGQKVWRHRTRGDYWVLNLESDSLYQLGGETPKETSLMFAKFSPDSQKVAYVQDNNIYVETLGSKNVTALTTNGSDTIINGNFD